MDPNRHHEYIASKEERSRAMYFNRGMEDILPHPPYFSQDRNTINNNKRPSCSCTNVPGNLGCNICRNGIATERSWHSAEQAQRTDFRNADTRNSTLRQSPMYSMHSNVSSRSPYWQQGSPSFPEDQGKHIPSPQKERTISSISSKNCSLEPNFSNYNSKQHQHQPQQQQQQQTQPHPMALQRVNAMSTYYKERSYDDKYSTKHELNVGTKIGYQPIASAPTTAIYNVDGHTSNAMDVMRTTKTDQHIINPSNVLASKEQHPSPNYARKCPQIFSPGEQNSAHVSLYVSTPQFSSDKFANVHTQRKMPHEEQQPSHPQEYRGHSNSASTPHMQMSSSMSVYASQSKYHPISEPIQTHIMSQPLRGVSYYPPSSSKEHASEMSPIIVKQSPHTHYQYSKSPIPPPSSTHMVSAKTPTGEIVEYMKKEDDYYDGHGVAPNRNLYVNPYNTPPSSDSCCKESFSPYGTSSNYRDDSPQGYHKYAKVAQETITSSNKRNTMNQTILPSNRDASYKRQPYYYETQPRNFDGNPLSAPSPAIATSASPSPSLLASQTQMHHMDYDASPQHSQTVHEMASHHNESLYDRPLQINTKIPCSSSNNNNNNNNNNSKMQPLAVQIAPPPPQSMHASKKSQAPKPNYKELINQVYAMRNSTSEEELNLQIIRKTLNVDSQPKRGAVPQAGSIQTVPTPLLPPPDKIKQNLPTASNPGVGLISAGIGAGVSVAITGPSSNCIRDNYRTEAVATSPQSLPKAAVEVSDVRRTIKQEEKFNAAPLDLSMRTVKTKADSTEYKYRQLPTNSQSVVYKTSAPTLPRVDFTPNFSLHTNDRSMATKSYMHTRREPTEPHPVYTSPELSHIPLAQPPIKHIVDGPPPIAPVNSYALKSQPPVTVQSPHIPPLVNELKINTSMSLIKATSKPMIDCEVETYQIRPSVLETNPYATVKILKSTTKLPDRNMLVVDQLPPDTSIMPLPKVIGISVSPHVSDMERTIEKPLQQSLPPPVQVQSQAIAAPQSAYSLACERNPNFLGRKRHLQEYSNSKLNESPVIKQPRYQEPFAKVEYMRPADITVIAVNEKKVAEIECTKTAEKSIQAEIPFNNENLHIVTCKKEPLTPTVTPVHTPTSMVIATTIVTPLPLATVKTEPNTTIARIRTKAELKGFTFPLVMEPNSNVIINPTITNTLTNPVPPITTNTKIAIRESIKIKEEYPQFSKTDMPSIPDLADEYSQTCLIDFSWNNACSNFMEQLMVNSKKMPLHMPQKKCASAGMVKLEMSEDDSAITMKSLSVSQDTVSTSTITAQKKISKLDREKMRLQQEARIAARLQDESSSESDNEMNKRKTERLKKPLKRAKSRHTATALADRNRFSDCGSDSTSDSAASNGITLKNLKNVNSNSNSDSNSSGNSSSNNINININNNSNSNNKNNNANEQSEITTSSSSPFNFKSAPFDEAATEKLRAANIGDGKKGKLATNAVANASNTLDDNEKRRTSANESECDTNTHRVEKVKEEFQKYDNAEHNDDDNDEDDDEDEDEEEEGYSNSNDLDKGNGECSRGRRRKIKENEGNINDNNDDSNVQYTDTANNKNNKFEKSVKKEKFSTKIGLNTMTRSKRKRELELQLANSKVLRNDKIIRNSTTKIKRKYVRKFTNTQNVGNKEAKALNRNNGNDDVITTRLRARNDSITKPNIRNKQKYLQNDGKDKNANNETVDMSSKHGKERQPNDLFMEVYRYKRSLKIPLSLITIKHPSNHKVAASLPDLERDADEMTAIFSSGGSQRGKSSIKSNYALKAQIKSEEPKSIIDYLHSRLKTTKVKTAKATTQPTSGGACSVTMYSETSQNTETNSISGELMPVPKKEDDEESNDGKKRHFSIFETKVLQTKTRTESKLQQKREIIREIFVGDDRPASAPPEMIQATDNGEKMTYEQKYEQFLQQMNIGLDEEKLRKFGRATTSIASLQASNVNIKHEEDTESASAIDADEKNYGDNQQDNVSVISGTTPTNFRRRRPGKYLRRKGSSGFDYIRKKKKYTPSTISSQQIAQTLIKTERLEDEDEMKVKTESDVCREIQKWVLNKGVGQSTMHKAARLGYIDVIVYCLDRMGMNPDQKDNAGYTPLHEACTNGWLEITRLLLQYGANHSEAAHSGIRPLHEASENDHEEIVRLLLSYGADPLLATYSGQTPLMLASSSAIRDFLINHLSDVQTIGPNRKPWRFKGPWEIYDPSECGYDIFAGAPNIACDMSRALRKSSVSNILANKKQFNQYGETSCKTVMDKCAVVLDNIDRFNSVRLYNDKKSEYLIENTDDDSDGDIFEFEEADILLPPLYLLKDEGTADKWVLLSDLCNLLKVKSKDTLLNKIYPASSISSSHKSLMRELKMSDFLEKATCLQLLCAGEKINICASKVVLIKYNESVKNLLGVKTILMKF